MVFSALLHKARSALIWRNHPQRRCFLLPLGEIFDAIWCQIKINTEPNVPNLSKSSFLWSHIFFSIFWHSEALHWPRDRKGGPQHVKLLFVVLTGNAAPYGRQRIYGDILMIIYVFESNRFKASKMCKTSLQKHNILWIIMCNRLYQATTKMALSRMSGKHKRR